MLQDALSEVMNLHPPMKPKACADDISAYMEVRNQEFRGVVQKVFKGDEKGSVLKLSITEGGKEGIASCSLLLATSVER